jgi:hypothetical protein
MDVRRPIIPICAALLISAAAIAAAPEPADFERAYVAAATPRGEEAFAITVDLAGDNLALSFADGRLHVLYRMTFNNVAEGWSWRPLADPAREDYYRFKFLPLGTVDREMGAPYVQEDFPGRPREVRRLWRYDYFLAFDNPYDFFARPTVEDDAGFTAEIAVSAAEAEALMRPGRLGMVARARPMAPAYAESSTFWKATDGKPVDLTLKNRYLMGHLEAVSFVDTASGRVLATLAPTSR